MHDNPTEHTCPHGSRPIDERCDACWREENDPIDFAMLTPPTRPGPCKAATAPEVDPVEKRLEDRRKQNEYRREFYTTPQGQQFSRWVEVKHGSGKVKV